MLTVMVKPESLWHFALLSLTKSHCDGVVDFRGGEWFEHFSFCSFAVEAPLSKSRNMISRSCKAIVSSDSWMDVEVVGSEDEIYFRELPCA